MFRLTNKQTSVWQRASNFWKSVSQSDMNNCVVVVAAVAYVLLTAVHFLDRVGASGGVRVGRWVARVLDVGAILVDVVATGAC